MTTSGPEPETTNSSERKKPSRGRQVALGLVITLALVGFAALFVRGPQWIDGIHTGHLGENDGPKATVVAGFRTSLAAALVGLVGIVTLYFTAATYRQNRAKDQSQFELAQTQFQHTLAVQAESEKRAQDQYDLSREGQITDRYVKAVGLLSETGDKAETIRLAGVYALERIMRDSEKDHATIVQLLAAFVRRGSPMAKGAEEDSVLVVPDDVKAALMVIGNRPARQEDFRIDLTNTSLRRLSLSDTNFEQADFSGSDLSYTVMLGTNFRQARFSDASLCHVVAQGVDLDGSHLQGANLYRSDLTDAKLGYAYLRKADLTAVTLKGADMAGASLVDAVLMAMDGSNLATISVEQLLTTEITSWTTLPEAFKDNPQLELHIAKCDEDYVTGTPRLS